MAETCIRAFAYPAAATPHLLHTVTGGKQFQCSSVLFCNHNSVSTTFRLWHRPLGAATANEQYAYYDTLVEANETYIATIGVTLIATDEVYAQSASGLVSISLFGVEHE